MIPIHVKTMANVDESKATNIIASAVKNIMERTVNVSKWLKKPDKFLCCVFVRWQDTKGDYEFLYN